jgi:hypothetical protein
MPQIVAADTEKIQKFMNSAIEAGCEGIMLKHLESVYRAGSREYLWIKVKREYRSELADTLDLVIVGALYGRGRRVGRYGALLLAAYDENQDLFRSVSKVGTGFTDQHLENFYNNLENLRISHKSPRVDTRMDQMDVWFEPKIVIEVIASEITLSPAHTAALNSIRENYGLALRFPKFTGKIRDDKNPEDATTVQELVKLFKLQQKKQTNRKNVWDSVLVKKSKSFFCGCFFCGWLLKQSAMICNIFAWFLASEFFPIVEPLQTEIGYWLSYLSYNIAAAAAVAVVVAAAAQRPAHRLNRHNFLKSLQRLGYLLGEQLLFTQEKN